MAYVTPGTVAAGDVATAAAWNVITNDVISHESRILPIGMVLLAPTSVQGSGVSVSNGKVTFTAASSVSVNGVFSATYDYYHMLFSCTPTAASTYFPFIRMRAAEIDTAGTNYDYVAVLGSGTMNQSSIRTVTGGYSGKHAGQVVFYDPFAALRTMVETSVTASTESTYLNRDAMTGIVKNNTQYDGFTLFTDASTTTGYLYVYGLSKTLA